MHEYIIEEFYDSLSGKINYRLKQGKYNVIIPKIDNGHVRLLQIQIAMQRLKRANEKKEEKHYNILTCGETIIY